MVVNNDPTERCPPLDALVTVTANGFKLPAGATCKFDELLVPLAVPWIKSNGPKSRASLSMPPMKSARPGNKIVEMRINFHLT